MWKIDNVPNTWGNLNTKIHHAADVANDLEIKVEFIKTVDQFIGIEN